MKGMRLFLSRATRSPQNERTAVGNIENKVISGRAWSIEMCGSMWTFVWITESSPTTYVIGSQRVRGDAQIKNERVLLTGRARWVCMSFHFVLFFVVVVATPRCINVHRINYILNADAVSGVQAHDKLHSAVFFFVCSFCWKNYLFSRCSSVRSFFYVTNDG